MYSLFRHSIIYRADIMDKTNVMRFLDKNKIPYGYHSYADSKAVSGMDVAAVLGCDPAKVFKTLVMRGDTRKIYVFLIPVKDKLDQKKAAEFLNEKSVEMVKGRELEPLTGYIHGGCSPLKMKKKYTTLIDSSAKTFDTILINAGMIGYMVEVSLADLNRVLEFELADLTF